MRLRLLLSGLAAAALLAGCTASSLVSQQANPEYVGKSFKSVMVVAVTEDEIVRRTYEDRMVALLARRGVKGVAGYSAIGGRGKVQEAALRKAVEGSGVDAVLITRVTSMDQVKTHISGGTLAVGYGWGGGYSGFYSGVWDVVSVGAQDVAGERWAASETRLFDARKEAMAWAGVVDTKETRNFGAALTQYVEIIFDAMVRDRVI
jgi:hypothetical protein